MGEARGGCGGVESIDSHVGSKLVTIYVSLIFFFFFLLLGRQ